MSAAAGAAAAEMPAGLAEATEHQPRARAALAAALASGPSHAYLFRGPSGSGKRAAARAFAAELLAQGSPDPESARRRALAEPSPHPDLVWIEPPGAWHLVDEIRASVIRAAALRPAEGERRVFVIAAAEAMRDESQNALLKTLEEPASFAHLILTCSEPEMLVATILSRCQPVEFAPLSPDAVVSELGDGAGGSELKAVARLCGGDLDFARLLLSEQGRELRSISELAARAPRAGGEPLAEPAWNSLLESAERAGADAAAAAEEELRERATEVRKRAGSEGKLPREAVEQVKRTGRLARTRSLDRGLGLCAAWYRDLVAAAENAEEATLNRDRLSELAEDAKGLESQNARHAVELVLDTRRRLRINVSEELALEALWLRLGETLR